MSSRIELNSLFKDCPSDDTNISKSAHSNHGLMERALHFIWSKSEKLLNDKLRLVCSMFNVVLFIVTLVEREQLTKQTFYILLASLLILELAHICGILIMMRPRSTNFVISKFTFYELLHLLAVLTAIYSINVTNAATTTTITLALIIRINQETANTMKL